MTPPVPDMTFAGLPLVVAGTLLCAYGFYSILKRGGLTAEGVINIMIGILIIIPGLLIHTEVVG